MSTSVLKIGSRATVRKKVRRDDSEFSTQIESVDGDRIRILTPLYKSILIRLHPGTRIEMSVFDGLNLYQFDAEAIDTVIDDKINYTNIKVTSDITKLERRSYFRVEVMQDILVRKKDDENPKDYSKGIAIDLSGGGIQFSSTGIISESSIIEIKIELDGEELNLDGEVLNRVHQEHLRSYKYMVKFIDLDKFTQEKIVRYVFKVQREKLQKEK